MAKLLKNGEILLYGTVGEGFFSDEGYFSAMDVADALAEIGRSKAVTARINSGGGDAIEGMAIHSQFSAHKGRVTMYVDSIAASAASIVAMAADELIMRKGSMMMIHDPSGITAGNAEDHEKTVEALDTIGDSMAEVYAERSGKEPREYRKDMKEEIWLTAEGAVNEGYADKVDVSKRARAIAAWDYRTYTNAPDRMVALAKEHGWRLSAKRAQVGAKKEEDEMANEKRGANAEAGADTAELETLISAALEKSFKARDDAAAEAAKKAAEAAKPAAGATATAETPEEMQKRIRSEEQKRMADITAACNLAGQAGKAATFIAEGKSLSEVVTALQEGRASGQQGQNGRTTQEINAHRGGGDQQNQPQVDAKKAWDKATSKINKRFEARHAA